MNQNQTLVIPSNFAREVVYSALADVSKEGYHFIFTATVEEVALSMINEHPHAESFEPRELIPLIIEWRSKHVH